MKKRTKKISVRLPNKLNKMLTKALDDVEKIETGKIKGYSINMSTFGSRPKANMSCEVCLGGTQLIGLFPKGQFEITLYADCSPATRKKLQALDALRTGCVSDALSYIGKSPSLGEHMDRIVRWYADNPKLWKAQMRLLAAELEEANL
jgi:hypothetical protein